MGAGLSGLAAATLLARAGKEVHVHDVRADSGARFDGDFQALENWSMDVDFFDQLVEWGFDISVNTYGFITKNVYKFTIHEKLESLEVNNNLFEDVLVIDLDIETYLDGDYIMSTNDYRYYYANGIGLIKSGSALFGGYSDLVEYTVQ